MKNIRNTLYFIFSDATTKAYVDGSLPYDYLSEFDIPKTIDIKIGYLDGSKVIKTGTAKVYNYLGYCVIDFNITVSSGNISYLFKNNSNDERLKANFYAAPATIVFNIVSGASCELRIDAQNNMYLIDVGVSKFKYLLPFNCK